MPTYSPESVAEHSVSLAMALNRCLSPPPFPAGGGDALITPVPLLQWPCHADPYHNMCQAFLCLRLGCSWSVVASTHHNERFTLNVQECGESTHQSAAGEPLATMWSQVMCRTLANQPWLTTVCRPALATSKATGFVHDRVSSPGLCDLCRVYTIIQGNFTLSGLIGRELNRKTVGILGTGAIGAAAARIWKV